MRHGRPFGPVGPALFGLILGLSLAAPAPAQPALPGLGQVDPRWPVDLTVPPWRAVGRVQTELGGRCTGALVGPRTVLTAAHCLVAARTGMFVRPDSVHFLLAYDRGAYVGHGRVTAYRIGPGYVAATQAPRTADWALLTLDTALGTPDRILPVLAAPPPPRTPLMLGGYQQDRPEVLLADTACRALGLVEDGALLLHDCAGTRGASGAPVVALGPGGRWSIAAVTSAQSSAMAMGVAVPARAFAAALR